MALNAVRELQNARFDMLITNVIRLMRMTVGARVFIVLPHMTALAVVFALLTMIQRERVDAQAGGQPGGGRVATHAIQSELTGVYGRLGVASGTVVGGAGSYRRHMAGATIQIHVPALYWKDRLMVKRHHRIMAIVASGAVVTIEQRVIGQEEWLGRRMACPAVDLVSSINAPGMAPFAKKRAIIIVSLMLDEAKVGQPVVLEGLQVVGGNGCFSPFMFSVALSALSRIRQAAVHTGLESTLFADISVAAFTAIGRAAQPGRMASATVALEVGVRCESRQRILSRSGGRELPRAKRPATKGAYKEPQNH
jgi:hypothetical protein